VRQTLACGLPRLSERKRERLAERHSKPPELAVIASIRHEDTDYDRLLMAGVNRAEARGRARDDVERALEAWRTRAVAEG
jgi:hypothetical protein